MPKAWSASNEGAAAMMKEEKGLGRQQPSFGNGAQTQKYKAMLCRSMEQQMGERVGTICVGAAGAGVEEEFVTGEEKEWGEATGSRRLAPGPTPDWPN